MKINVTNFFYDEKVVMRREAIELMAGWKWLNGERMREGKIKKKNEYERGRGRKTLKNITVGLDENPY